jgi:hypothetical protein
VTWELVGLAMGQVAVGEMEYDARASGGHWSECGKGEGDMGRSGVLV